MLLRNKDRDTLTNIFAAAKTEMEVWAYGSRVNGTAHEGSDLDLVVRCKSGEKMDANILADLKENIHESNIPILVELFDWERLPESFHKNIEARHEVLYNNIALIVNEPTIDYPAPPAEGSIH